MHQFAGKRQIFLPLLLVGFKNIDGERSGQRRQRASGSRIGRGDKPDDENHTDKHRESLAPRDIAEQSVANHLTVLHRKIVAGIHIKQRAKHEEQPDYEYLDERAYNHVLLRLAEILAAQCALHQILIKAGSGYHHKHTGDELLPEIMPVVRVVEEENLARRMVGHSRRQFKQPEPQTFRNIDNTAYH